MFAAARGAKALIDAGFTSAYGASEAKLRLGVAVRNEVNAGRLPGPRIRAGGLEISVTGAMGDESKEHNPRVGPSMIVDGVEEMRKAVRFCCREGCDNIKLDVSGDPFYPSTPGAHDADEPSTRSAWRSKPRTPIGRKVNAHTRSIDGSKALHPGGRRRAVPLRIFRRGTARHDGGGEGPHLRRADRQPVPHDRQRRSRRPTA